MKNIVNKITKNKALMIGILCLLPILIEFLSVKEFIIDKALFLRLGILYAIYALIAVFYFLNKKSKFIYNIVEFFIKYRYIIVTILFIILVLLKVNFSSIDIWKNYTNEDESSNLVYGNARSIRSDEWLMLTPMMIGQSESTENFPIYNSNIAQGNSNMLMINVPVMDILAFVRPFTWGFILFGAEYGFSFYWALKIIALFIVSLELMFIITKKDKFLSITGSIVLTLAPAMMWWFSTSIVDAYIFGTATIVLFNYYMNNLEWKIWKKILIAIGLIICIPAFAFTLYPAFQVPFAIIMLVFMLNSFIPNIKKINVKDILIMVGTIIIILLFIFRFVSISFKDIQLMMGTVYPGERFETGGDLPFSSFISYLINIFFAYKIPIQNPSELSSYIYPFTALLILIIYNLKNINNQKKDYLKIGLTVLYFIFLIWEFVGFHPIFAKITFMYFSQTTRTHVALGIIGTLLCFMYIQDSSKKEFLSKLQAFVISIVVTIFAFVILENSDFSQFCTNIKYEIILSMLFFMTYLMITKSKKAWCFLMCIIAIVAGINVNPISIGLTPINNSIISKEIQNIKNNDTNALWIGDSNISGQYLVANGVKCLNGINTYPNYKWLDIVDKEKKYESIYNRYAHISIELGKETEFILLAPDAYVAILDIDDIKNLEIKYYYCIGECSPETIEQFNLNIIYSDIERNQYIYSFNY